MSQKVESELLFEEALKHPKDRLWISDLIIKRQLGHMRLEQREGCPYEDFILHETDYKSTLDKFRKRYTMYSDDPYEKNGYRDTFHKLNQIRLPLFEVPINGLHLKCEYCSTYQFIRGCYSKLWVTSWFGSWTIRHYRIIHGRFCTCDFKLTRKDYSIAVIKTKRTTFAIPSKLYDHFMEYRYHPTWHDNCLKNCKVHEIEKTKNGIGRSCISCGITHDLVKCPHCEYWLCNTKDTGSWRNGKSCHRRHILYTDCVKIQIKELITSGIYSTHPDRCSNCGKTMRYSEYEGYWCNKCDHREKYKNYIPRESFDPYEFIKDLMDEIVLEAKEAGRNF